MRALIHGLACCACLLAASSRVGCAQMAKSAGSPAAPRASVGYRAADGSVRIVGSPELEELITKLNALYTRQHPGTTFTYVKANNLAATYALEFDASAFAPVTTYFAGGATYADIAHGPAFSIRLAHGSLEPGVALSPYVVIVNTVNPVDSVTISELAAMFTQPLRQRVTSHWDQLGKAGGLGGVAVLPCGLPWSDHYVSEDPGFADDIFVRKFAGAPPVEAYQGFSTYEQAIRFVAANVGAVAIVPANRPLAGTKVVGVVDSVFGAPQRGTSAEIAEGRYPLDRSAYINVHAVTGKPLDPLVLEYLHMVLSPAGQDVIAHSASRYIPLSATEVQEEVAKLR